MMKKTHSFYSGNGLPSRSATVLIIVVGIAGLLASLALAFIGKVWISGARPDALIKETQARMMLHAACAYVLEAGRMGYGPDPSQPSTYPLNGMIQDRSDVGVVSMQHREAFGWIDVRTNNLAEAGHAGVVGPLDQNYNPVYSGSAWPAVGGVVIGSMYRWRIPRYAISQRMNYNPIETDPTRTNYGYPFLSIPDPQPVGMDVVRDRILNDGSLSDETTLRDQSKLNKLFRKFVFTQSEDASGGADPTPCVDSVGLSWFRVLRRSPSTFIITCGSGGTMGFKSWSELVSPPANLSLSEDLRNPTALIQTEEMFNALRSAETIFWYEIRWSASVRVYTGAGLYMNAQLALPADALPVYPYNTWGNILQHGFSAYGGQSVMTPINQSMTRGKIIVGADIYGKGVNQLPPFAPNHLGTISYIQRLGTGVSNGTIGYIQPSVDPTQVRTDW